MELSSHPNVKLLSKKDYRDQLASSLSEDDHKSDKSELFRYFVLMSVYLFGIYTLSASENLLLKIILSLGLGIILAAISFFLHDLMHGSIVKSKTLMYFIGITAGVFNFFPPLFWQRLHNFHHARTGKLDDPDRNWTLDEMPVKPHEIIIYKLRMSNECYNKISSFIFIAVGFLAYFISNIFYGVYATNLSEQSSIKYRGLRNLFNTKDRMFVTLELLTIFSVQLYLFAVISNFSLITFLLVSTIPLLICHFILMLYIHTNHIFSPLTGEVDDPLINSVSIKNSKFVDFIFSNFSHHVEHHLYPSMCSAKYPKVRKLIQEKFSDRFQLMTMKDAISYLFNSPRIYANAYSLVGIHTDEKHHCVMPEELKNLFKVQTKQPVSHI
jgi:fatty acid desaturase